MRDELVSFIQRRGDETLAAALTAVALVQISLLDEPAGARLAASAGAVALGAAAARRVRMPLLLLGLLLVGSAAGAALPKRLGRRRGDRIVHSPRRLQRCRAHERSQ